jgi:hypothetical protein
LLIISLLLLLLLLAFMVLAVLVVTAVGVVPLIMPGCVGASVAMELLGPEHC